MSANVALKSDPKPQAGVRVLRRLALAIKASALYPASHPGRAEAVDAVVTELRKYTEAHGPFSLHIAKQALSIDGVPVDDQSNLANLLYTRKVSQVTILPSAGPSQIAAFLSIAGMERSQLEAAGGLEHLLQKAGAWDIHVTELVLRVKEDAEILDLGAFFALLGQGRLSPQERDRVIDILRSGSDHAVKLLQNVYTLAGEVLSGTRAESPGRQVYEAIRSLDRIILNEPADRQQLLYEHLAQATCRLGSPIYGHLAPALLSGAKDDTGVQVVLNHLSGEQLAELILTAGEDKVSTDEVLSILRCLAPEREKAKGVLVVLDRRLPARGEGGASLTETILPQLRFISDALEKNGDVAVLDESAIVVSADELAAYEKEARSLDESAAEREGLRTVLDLLRNEVEQREFLDAAQSLTGYLRALVDRGEFALLRESLEVLKALSSQATEGRPRVITGILEDTAGGAFLDRALAVLSDGKPAVAVQDIWSCLGLLGKHTIGPLVRRLGDEPPLEMREFLCDMLVRLGPEHVETLGAFVTDERSHVVRQIAHILGRMRRPEGINHLARLVRHADIRVRVEALDALARIRTEAAQAQICLFLHDAESLVRLRALSSLDAHGMALAMPVLAPLVEAPDLFNQRFVFRRAAITAMGQVRVREALPSLKKVAGAALAIGRCRRELRRLARLAVAAIEQPVHARTPEGHKERR